jgi:uncharacterized protein YkuJ
VLRSKVNEAIARGDNISDIVDRLREIVEEDAHSEAEVNYESDGETLYSNRNPSDDSPEDENVEIMDGTSDLIKEWIRANMPDQAAQLGL